MLLQQFMKVNFGKQVELLHFDDASVCRGTVCRFEGELALADLIGWIVPNMAYFSHARLQGEKIWQVLKVQ